jgi:hypothetical protein
MRTPYSYCEKDSTYAANTPQINYEISLTSGWKNGTLLLQRVI